MLLHAPGPAPPGLAAAHLAALDTLTAGGPSQVFNAGTGKGYTVLEVIRAAEAVTGRKLVKS